MVQRSMCYQRPGLLVFCLCFLLFWTSVASGQETSDDLFPELDNIGADENAAAETAGEFSASENSASSEQGEGTPEQLTPEQVLDQADQLLQAGQYLDAIGRYSALLNYRQFSNNVRALVGRGKAFAELKSFDLALKSLDRAVNAAGMGTTNPFALNERGKVYMEIEKFNEAVLDFGKAVETYPTQTEFVKNYGKALIKQGAKESQLGDLEAAANVPKGIGSLANVITQLSEAVEKPEFAERRSTIEVELAEVYFERGLGQLLMRDIENALADLEKARELDPDNLEYADQLAAAYFQNAIEQGMSFPESPEKLITNYTNAISTLEETIEKAEALEAAQEDAQTEDGPDSDLQSSNDQFDIQKIPELYARVASGHIELAKYLPVEQRAHSYQAAIEASQKTLNLEPQFADAYLLQGTGYRMLLEFDKAVEAFSEAVRLTGSNEARFRRGIVYYHQNEMGLALRDFEGIRSQRTGSRDTRGQFWAGIVHLANQDYYDAIKLFSDCISSNPRYVLAYSNRGAAYLKVGKYNRAIKDFNEVIRREPSSPKGYQLREVAYQLKGTHN